MKSKHPLPLLLRMLGVLTGDTCPTCGATGDNIAEGVCLLCMMDDAVLRMEEMGTSPENIAEIRERIKRARAGEKLPPWEEKVSTIKDESEG